MNPDIPDGPIENEKLRPSAQNQLSLLSHDLRSALSDILGGLRLVESEKLDTETQAHFDRVKVASEALARLMDKTMSDDALDPNNQMTSVVNINLSEFLNDTRKRWAGRAKDTGITFALESSTSLPAIITLDRVSLDRVLANLIGNAIKFTDVGQVVLLVDCRADRALCFTIRDEGQGFSPEALERLFEYQGRPDRADKPGSGLGLYIAKELSGVLGAELAISNRAVGGAEAQLTIPHSTWFDRALRREGKSHQLVQNKQVDLSGLRILLAEDNKTNQLVATQMLRSMGAEFAVASDGIEAFEMLGRERFDLALLDIEMPRMTGLELIKAVRSMPAPVCNMPLVALTAYVMREHRERIYGAGADGIIAKPVMSITELGLAILGYMNGTKSRMRMEPANSTDAAQATDMIVDQDVFATLVETIGQDSLSELLGKLLADTDSVAEGIGLGRKSLDLAEIRSQTHILVSVAGAIGAQPLQHVAQRLNTAANRQDAAEVDDLCGECLSGLKALQGFILAQQDKAAPPP
ncbi:MAG: two-component system aerobic respiration control sensor histidine kinase ArcB [Paracoccaceae bacterium]